MKPRAAVGPILVVDTSYWLEWYGVPDFCDPVHMRQVRAKFAALKDVPGSRLFVPLPVVFEVANHIADSSGDRHRLAEQFKEHVLRALGSSAGVPFKVSPGVDPASLRELLAAFAGEFAAGKIGLSDTAIVYEARRLKEKYGAACPVHIWTKDCRLKAQEPDPEPAPFVG